MSGRGRELSRRAFFTASGATAASLLALPMLAVAQATPPASISLPDSPAGRQIAWVLDHVRPDTAALTEAEIEAHFSPDFLAQVPADQLAMVFQQVAAAYGPLVVTAIAGDESGNELLADVTTRTGEAWNVYIVVEPSGEHRITGLQFLPAQSQATPVPLSGFDDLIQRWSTFAESAGLLIAEIDGSHLRPLASLRETGQLAIGSDFKLYVLGAVASAIAAGQLTWNDDLAIQDRLKSLPSGELQNDPAGTRRPIRAFAEKMISISDNTAADHLLDLVGRAAVEAMMPLMGNSDPSKSLPFLSTAEMFKLKLVATDEQRANYIAADVERRRTLLTDVIDPLSLADANIASWTGPKAIDTLEWFASPADLANAMLDFQQSAEKPGFEPVAEILAINPGIAFDTAKWPYVGFKGGSEPGVLALAWLLRRADDRWFVVTGALNDTRKEINEGEAILTFAGFQKLLDMQP